MSKGFTYWEMLLSLLLISTLMLISLSFFRPQTCSLEAQRLSDFIERTRLYAHLTGHTVLILPLLEKTSVLYAYDAERLIFTFHTEAHLSYRGFPSSDSLSIYPDGSAERNGHFFITTPYLESCLLTHNRLLRFQQKSDQDLL